MCLGVKLCEKNCLSFFQMQTVYSFTCKQSVEDCCVARHCAKFSRNLIYSRVNPVPKLEEEEILSMKLLVHTKDMLREWHNSIPFSAGNKIFTLKTNYQPDTPLSIRSEQKRIPIKYNFWVWPLALYININNYSNNNCYYNCFVFSFVNDALNCNVLLPKFRCDTRYRQI